jgi:heptosyltransferase-2
MKLGIFLPNWIGDAAMATPMLRALRTHYGPDAEMIGILRPYVADVLAGTPWLDGQIFYDPRSDDPTQRGLPLVQKLRAARFDSLLLSTNSLRAALLAWASGARERIGYVRNGRGLLLTKKLLPARAGRRLVPTSVVDYYLELAYAIGCRPEEPRIELATTLADERQADTAWSRLRLPGGHQVVTLNSGGAFGAAKLWPSGYFAVLARRIATEMNRAVLVVCGPSEREIAREIVRGAAHPHVVSIADEPVSIGLTKACIRRSDLLVTTDSGPRHFAAAFDVPVVTLFGPTDIRWSENYYPRAIHLQLGLDCVPCQQRSCPLGHHRCMRDLSADRVFEAVEAALDRRMSHAA